MKDVLGTLSQYPIRTRVSLTGTLVVARDIAHAKLQERLNNGEGLPQYMLDHPVYYAGPAKTPEVSVKVEFGRHCYALSAPKMRANWSLQFDLNPLVN